MLLFDLDKRLPRWATQGPRRFLGSLIAGLTAALDSMAEGVLQGRLAASPGQVDLPGVAGLGGYDSIDALPMIGRDRMIRRGLEEGPAEYAARLRAWRRSWSRAGTPMMLLEQLAGILGPNPPKMRLVNSNGTWWTRYEDSAFRLATQRGDGLYFAADGTIEPFADVPNEWDWDSASQPPHPEQGDMSRFWVIIYAPCNLPHLSADDGTIDDEGHVDDYAAEPWAWPAGESPEAGTVGTVAPWKIVELVRGTIADWRTAGAKCSHVIVTFDASSFSPTSDTIPSSVPDGSWGWHCKIDGGARVPSRFPDAEYWPSDPGGLH